MICPTVPRQLVRSVFCCTFSVQHLVWSLYWRTSRPRRLRYEKHDWPSFSNQRVNQYEEVLLRWNATRLCFVVLCIGLNAVSCAWMQTV